MMRTLIVKKTRVIRDTNLPERTRSTIYSGAVFVRKLAEREK
jgi:hypothetical protein